MSDINLFYTDTGSGFPLVLLHGNDESSDYFKGQLGCFSERFRVIAVDTRGHGHSPRGSAPFNLSQFVKDLKQLLDTLGISRLNLLGFSDGGNIALIFALKYPAYIEKLILNGANLSPSGVKLSEQFPILLGYAALSVITLFDKRAAAKKEMLALMVKEPNIDPDDLKSLSMPVLVIVGKHDMIKDSHSALIASSLPDSRLVTLEGNHFIAAANPQAFNDAVIDFLT